LSLSFAQHFAQAEEWPRTKGALPLIDESGLDFSAEIGELDSDYLDLLSASSEPYNGSVTVLEDFVDLLPPPSSSFAPDHVPADPARRFVALSFLWQLSLRGGIGLGEDDETGRTEKIRADLKNVIGWFEPAACAAVWQVRWELAAAVVGGCSERVDPLVKAWLRLAPDERRTAIEAGARIKLMAAMLNTSGRYGRWWVDYPQWPGINASSGGEDIPSDARGGRPSAGAPVRCARRMGFFGDRSANEQCGSHS
jgi:hypothetical protein